MVDTVGAYEVPVATAVPPVDAVYQLMVPALATADKLATPEPHKVAPVTEVILGAPAIETVAVLFVETGVLHVNPE